MKTSFVLFTEYLSNKNNLELKWDSEAWFSVSKDVIKDVILEAADQPKIVTIFSFPTLG